MKAVVKGVGCELTDIWECGLLRNKEREWNITSLDGWMRIKMPGSLARVDESEDDSDDGDGNSGVTENANQCTATNNDNDPNRSVVINCGLEIKTPSSKKVIRNKILPAIELGGVFSNCEFGDSMFKVLVYNVGYRVQLLHHVTVANLDHILFVVASERGVRYATLVHFPHNKRDTYRGFLDGIYNRCLKWAYEDAWESDDPIAHIPDVRQEVISSSSYPIDKDSIAVGYCILETTPAKSESCPAATTPCKEASTFNHHNVESRKRAYR